jgi:antitoxin component HigA of HigAB toxin-antitoxin module
LAHLLGVHASMGSKILKGDRKLTADHLRKLTERFHVEASLFL